MIGNETDARTALSLPSCRGILPDGWRYIGEGISRFAYLSPEGVVYKVGSDFSNEWEFENFSRLMVDYHYIMQTTRFRIPKMALYHVGVDTVIAAEYVPNKGKFDCARNYYYGNDFCSCNQPICYHDMVDVIEATLGISDIHFDNVHIDSEGNFWVIDLECSA